jgi:hypothetical protein
MLTSDRHPMFVQKIIDWIASHPNMYYVCADCGAHGGWLLEGKITTLARCLDNSKCRLCDHPSHDWTFVDGPEYED